MSTVPDQDMRRYWLSVLAKAEPGEIGAAWDALGEPADLTVIRAPEVGLVMARGRIGGSGRPFNLGEVTVTRCSVRTRDGTVGHGYVRGRNKRHAMLVARFDALLQDRDRQGALLRHVVRPLAEAQAARRAAVARKAAATRVEFFTLVRGDG